jgi:ABC-type multidrug transport system ATPase subunit
MGPSGAGKTTVLRALNGYSAPSTGSVFFNGQDLYGNYDAFRLQLGYVPQDDIMHRELTVGEALYYSAACVCRVTSATPSCAAASAR